MFLPSKPAEFWICDGHNAIVIRYMVGIDIHATWEILEAIHPLLMNFVYPLFGSY